MSDAADRRFMARALQLAARGSRSVSPNPQVGCVITVGEQVVGEGWHVRAGGDHAEVAALKDAGDRAAGATVYVTLEPCAHRGRTGPCCQALIDADVARVVIATRDPNPAVSGRGIAALTAAGIAVECGLLETEARRMNRGFMQRHELGRPWVQLKIAASMDGRTAMASGDSQWITGDAARADVQRMRAASCAIVTGIGTVLADDPRLNVRDCAAEDGITRQPLRVVLDSDLQTPADARVVTGEGRALVICRGGADRSRRDMLVAAGAEVVEVAATDGGIDLSLVLQLLAARECNEVMFECGGTLAGAMLAVGLVDGITLYMAPQLLGSTARPLVALPIADMAARRRLHIESMRNVGDDLRLELRPVVNARD